MIGLLQRLRDTLSEAVDQHAVRWVVERARQGELPRQGLHQVLERLAAAAGAKLELQEHP